MTFSAEQQYGWGGGKAILPELLYKSLYKKNHLLDGETHTGKHENFFLQTRGNTQRMFLNIYRTYLSLNSLVAVPFIRLKRPSHGKLKLANSSWCV